MRRYEIRYQSGQWSLLREGDPTRIGRAFAKDRVFDIATTKFAAEQFVLTVFRRNGDLDAVWTFVPGETPKVRFAPQPSRRWPPKDSDDQIASAE